MIMWKTVYLWFFLCITVFIFGACQNICDKHPGCHKAAENLLNSIDTSKDPCSNFFEYACGKWKQNNPIPQDRAGYSTLDSIDLNVAERMKSLLEDTQISALKAIRLAKHMYSACMDTGRINDIKSKPLLKAIYSLDGWPLITPTWKLNDDLTDLLGQLYRDYGVDIFFKFDVVPEHKNISNPMTLTMNHANLAYSTSEKHDIEPRLSSNRTYTPFKKLILDTISLIATDMNSQITDQILDGVDEIHSFYLEIKELVDDYEIFNGDQDKKDISSLNELFPSINWMKFFRMTLPTELFALVQKEDFQVIVPVTLLSTMQEFIKSSDKRVVKNYIMWRLADSLINDLDDRYDDIVQEYKSKVYDSQPMKPMRWKKCVDTVSDLFGTAVDAMYVRKYFAPEDKGEVLSMVKNIQQSFRTMVDDSDWMDFQTKQQALEKIDTTIAQVAYPDFLLNDALVNEQYQNLVYNGFSNYFNLKRLITIWKRNNNLNQLMKQFDRTKFINSAIDVNAYHAKENIIGFPAGILQPPVFRKDFPKAVNYGAIGSIIGHEIAHGFDPANIKFDKVGNLKTWPSALTELEYESKTDCFVRQYSNYMLDDIYEFVDGRKTLNDNIADNGGIKSAFLAYQAYLRMNGGEEPRLPGLQNMTNEQIFFISFANSWCNNVTPKYASAMLKRDKHSPNIFRVIGTLSNSDEFSKAFNCKKLSNTTQLEDLAPEKCSLW